AGRRPPPRRVGARGARAGGPGGRRRAALAGRRNRRSGRAHARRLGRGRSAGCTAVIRRRRRRAPDGRALVAGLASAPVRLFVGDGDLAWTFAALGARPSATPFAADDADVVV